MTIKLASNTVKFDTPPFRFVDQFCRTRFDLLKGFEHEPEAVDTFIRKQYSDAWVGLDISGSEYFGYSYAKQTIRVPIQRLVAGLYENRRILIIAEIPSDDPNFLEGVSDALSQVKLSAMLASSPAEPVSKWQIIGLLADHLRDTFAHLVKSGPITTADFSPIIGQSIPNTNNRLRDLQSLGLIRRKKLISPSGGHEWLNQVL